ncbi:hypothetical protein Bpfe_009297 [Biomphalaria pfeifferi]|uniref:Uncharacterized protein n=1 Tax=Biomphalaria pfeifferi TaxID=112525 RepID=A0AAD8BUK5_BIOPF|nr:hypothetical protein Bpfe_009297 [Biomphalaria pfeifferi]
MLFNVVHKSARVVQLGAKSSSVLSTQDKLLCQDNAEKSHYFIKTVQRSPNAFIKTVQRSPNALSTHFREVPMLYQDSAEKSQCFIKTVQRSSNALST